MWSKVEGAPGVRTLLAWRYQTSPALAAPRPSVHQILLYNSDNCGTSALGLLGPSTAANAREVTNAVACVHQLLRQTSAELAQTAAVAKAAALAYQCQLVTAAATAPWRNDDLSKHLPAASSKIRRLRRLGPVFEFPTMTNKNDKNAKNKKKIYNSFF